jgi:nucleotidyltransferase family protein
MAKKPVLVVLAAGMGSRYGGLKQIDPVGSQGEAILDYSIYDAHQAGFDTVVIIIKEAIKKDFLETVGKRLEKAPVEIRYAYQELTDLPEGFTVPEGRVKPWGTAHAVFCAREAIDGAPFAVVNADDYYGKAAFKVIYDQLAATTDPHAYCMVGYELGKTVTENGSVARGICQVNANGYLEEVVERTHIETYPGGIRYLEDGIYTDVSPDTIVSMNMWGFMPSFLDELEGRFSAFLQEALKTNPLKCEFFLPLPITQLIQEKKATFRVLSSPDRWFGVTYAADKPMVVNALKAMTDAGKYPDGLWK